MVRAGAHVFLEADIRRSIDIGLLYSRSGSYARMSHACRTGALSAVATVNADAAMPLSLRVIEADPQGDPDRYAPLCAAMIAGGVRHVVGCITSSSRKEVIPVLEKGDATLFYACPYEGFEASDRVIYTHASPNQHLLPLLDWAMARFGGRAWLAGSNYIWGWEMNRIARDVVRTGGGSVLGERHLALGDEDVGRLIDEVREARPDFVLNTLIGASSYAFLRAFAELGRADARFRSDACPVLSCNLTECELGALGADAEGLVSVGPFFAGEPGRPGPDIRRGIGAGIGAGIGPRIARCGSSYEAAAHAAVLCLAAMLAAGPSDGSGDAAGPAELLARDGVRELGFDPKTHHARLPVLIARVRRGRFEVTHRHPVVAADPYLAGRPAPAHGARPVPPRLRVVG